MESIAHIRQMMAEQKFYEVQPIIEAQLSINSEGRDELILLYREVLNAQDKNLPLPLLFELAEVESAKKNHDFVLALLNSVDDKIKFLLQTKLRLRAAEDRGQMDQLYQIVSEFLIYQYEHQIPSVPDWIEACVTTYFNHDFQLKLKKLALTLLRTDLENSEVFIRELIASCLERSSPRGTNERLRAVYKILQSTDQKGVLAIYQSLCSIWCDGIREATDIKRVVEIIIYFEDFRFQVISLKLIHHLGLFEDAASFATALKAHKDYNFVYLDKYFGELKTYFVNPLPREIIASEVFVPDLELKEAVQGEAHSSPWEYLPEEGNHFSHLLKYQSYSSSQLCDLAVSFLQSEMPKVALEASELAITSAGSDQEYLKGAYLKLTSLLQLRDYRAALDTSFQALERAHSSDDVLSFLYGQAEIYLRMKEKKAAKKILSKILSIDSSYRLAKERLEKL